MSLTLVQYIISRASAGKIDFVLEGDVLRLRIAKDAVVDPDLLDLIRQNKEALRSFLRDNAVEGNVNHKIPLARTSMPGRVPLSFSQERLWFIDRLEGSQSYHMPWVLRLEGELDTDALSAALESVVERHEVLRTVVVEHEGVGYQEVRSAQSWKMEYEEH